MIRPFMWIILTLLALVLSWTTQASYFAWVGYVMLAIFLLGYLIVRLSTGRLAAWREVTRDRIHFGDRVEVRVRVENASPLPALWVVAAESLPVGLPVTGSRGQVLSLVGKEGFTFSYFLEGARRGYHEIGPTVLRSGDLFGLFQRREEGGGSAWLTVFPKIIPLQKPYFTALRPVSEVRVRRRVLEDPTQIVGIRPYQHGDGQRRVHWRATAHTGKLQSKLYEITAQQEVTLLLNLSRADYPLNPDDAAMAAELAITTAASMAQYLLGATPRVGLVALARDPSGMGGERVVSVPTNRGRAHLVLLLSVLGRIELGRTDTLPEVLHQQKERFSWGSLVMVITPRLDDEALLALFNLRSSGYGVKLILVGRHLPMPNGADIATLGLGAVRVHTEEDIRGLDL